MTHIPRNDSLFPPNLIRIKGKNEVCTSQFTCSVPQFVTNLGQETFLEINGPFLLPVMRCCCLMVSPQIDDNVSSLFVVVWILYKTGPSIAFMSISGWLKWAYRIHGTAVKSTCTVVLNNILVYFLEILRQHFLDLQIERNGIVLEFYLYLDRMFSQDNWEL